MLGFWGYRYKSGEKIKDFSSNKDAYVFIFTD